MTYEQAQIVIDDSSRQDDVAASLRTLNALAKKLKQKRLDNGALLLASPEIRFEVILIIFFSVTLIKAFFILLIFFFDALVKHYFIYTLLFFYLFI